VHRLVVLPDYHGIDLGKRLLNYIAELYSSQTKAHFYIITSNPQTVRANNSNWKIKRFGHASQGHDDTRINNEIRNSLSRKRITVSLQYIPINHLSHRELSANGHSIPKLHRRCNTSIPKNHFFNRNRSIKHAEHKAPFNFSQRSTIRSEKVYFLR
jgi:hypothetical protein